MKLLKSLTLIVSLGLLGGCSVVVGDFVPKSHFVFPNSNIKVTGQAFASMKKTNFITPPKVTTEEVNSLLKEARMNSSADLIIDYSLDTKLTSYPFYYELEITLVGTAASMDIGRQKLLDVDFY